jgi:hypothetical protein
LLQTELRRIVSVGIFAQNKALDVFAGLQAAKNIEPSDRRNGDVDIVISVWHSIDSSPKLLGVSMKIEKVAHLLVRQNPILCEPSRQISDVVPLATQEETQSKRALGDQIAHMRMIARTEVFGGLVHADPITAPILIEAL